MKSKSKSPRPFPPGSERYPRSHSSTPVDMGEPGSHEASVLLSAVSRSDKARSHHRRAYDELPSMNWPLPNHHSHHKHRGFDNVSDEDVNLGVRDRDLYIDQWSGDRRSRKRYASEDDEDHESSEERHKAKRVKHKHHRKSKHHHWRDGEPREYSRNTSSFSHDEKHRHGHKSQIFP